MLNVVGYGMLIIGGIVIIISLIMMIVWRVPSIIDELSGRKAKRQIARMKKLGSNYKSKSSSSEDLSGVTYSKNTGLKGNTPDFEGKDLSSLVNNPISVSTDYVRVKNKQEGQKVINKDDDEGATDIKESKEGDTSFFTDSNEELGNSLNKSDDSKNGVESSDEEKTSFMSHTSNDDFNSDIENENTSFIADTSEVGNTSFIGDIDSSEDENTSFIADTSEVGNTSFIDSTISEDDSTSFVDNDEESMTVDTKDVTITSGINVLYEDISIDLSKEGIL